MNIPHNQGLCKPDCFGCKVQGFGISSKAMPTRRAKQNANAQFIETEMKDIDAYKRLKADGFQPRATQGCARVEALATTPFEVENNYVIRHPDLARRVDETHREIKTANIIPLPSASE